MTEITWQQRWEEAAARGLYRPALEHDACGVGFVADIHGARTHAIMEQALFVLSNLSHRGACGADPLTGDGAGVLFQIPDRFLRAECRSWGFELPEPGRYGVAMVFLPRAAEVQQAVRDLMEHVVRDEGQRVLGWREVPVDPSQVGPVARSAMPAIAQLFIGAGDLAGTTDAFERKLYVIRKRVGHEVRAESIPAADRPYVCSLSARTIVYKGLLMATQLPRFYPDLQQPAVETALAIVHQRFSTNTLPSWERAQPLRMLAHNGEINTIRGNVNWMRARERLFESPLFGDDMAKLLPVIDQTASDSAMLDSALELLVQTGRSVPHALMTMIPEAWQKNLEMPDERRAFYEYNGCMMEPWDGPAAIAFTDGVTVGAVLDRNGLRPLRYVVTRDGLVVGASEVGVLDIPDDRVMKKERLQPGQMLLVDTAAQRLICDEEVKAIVSSRRPYRAWVDEMMTRLDALEAPDPADFPATPDEAGLRRLQLLHGYTREDLELVLAPMAETAKEPLGSMGNDAPLAVLSDRPQPLYNYFRQLFAQVTNPPIDPIREELVMSLRTTLGSRHNLFEEGPSHCRRLALEQPVLTNEALARVKALDKDDLHSAVLGTLYPVAEGGAGLEAALTELCDAAVEAVQSGATLLVLSDRGADATRAPIPSLLATAAVHHRLIRESERTRCALVVESGEPREVMHFCLLLGYGAGAVNPYLAFETLDAMATAGTVEVDRETARRSFVAAIGKGIYKVMSKMGISTLDSYRGAQVFEAVGIRKDVIDRYFTWTSSRIEGIGLDVIAQEYGQWHRDAFAPEGPAAELDEGGRYRWRRRGERHAYNPDTIATLQHAVRKGSYDQFKRYSGLVDAESERLHTLRGLLRFKADPTRPPVPIDEVEPVESIVRRFKTGAMSFGSISREAHETLAIAMNRIGGKSNTGEGGEDPARYTRDANGDSRRSAIKQVASGRFGVTSHYLVNADELQIKMAQGAKPGEGGQLPGHKVDETIARLRYSTPGVGLISPPPHHDIYSIEDLAQLIHDLKNANEHARVSVKLVSEVGVGTVAAGVAKAKADTILISGDSGGTGAAPLSSVKHAGVPWELGLAEAQQVLVLNGLRGRVRLETDGQLKTGRDVAIAVLLGAEELGFATSALVASGCVMMRACHLNTCPVGVATQDPKLRERFSGKPEHVVNMMMFIAQELREHMAALGFRTVDAMVGRSDVLEARGTDHWKARHLDLSQMLYRPEGGSARCVEDQDHGLDEALDRRLVELARPALDGGTRVEFELPVKNVDRTVGTLLSSNISRHYGIDGLPPGTIGLRLFGTGGQSFGAFLANGVDIRLEGDANDYFGKGLSGGRIVVVPPEDSTFVPEDNVIVGNVALYGATGGEVFLRGLAGERFAVRNSGAVAVVEGVGDHGCEYMTGGRVVVLGRTGRNFAAGMSGGAAFVLDVDGRLQSRCNLEMVELLPFDEEDAALVRSLVHRHVELTSSAVGWRILSGWRDHLPRFVKVMPVEYRRALTRSRGAAEDSEPAVQAQ